MNLATLIERARLTPAERLARLFRLHCRLASDSIFRHDGKRGALLRILSDLW